jgi:hypothetical protein
MAPPTIGGRVSVFNGIADALRCPQRKPSWTGARFPVLWRKHQTKSVVSDYDFAYHPPMRDTYAILALRRKRAYLAGEIVQAER